MPTPTLYPPVSAKPKFTAIRELATLGAVVVEYHGSMRSAHGLYLASPTEVMPGSLELISPEGPDFNLFVARERNVTPLAFYGN